MKIKFFNLGNSELLFEQEKDDAAELTNVLIPGKQINLSYVKEEKLLSFDAIFSHHTLIERGNSNDDTLCLYFNLVENNI